MIRSLGAFSAFLAIVPAGVYCAGASFASPPAGSGQCSFSITAPNVVKVSGVDVVTASMSRGVCTVHAHTEATVCLVVEGDGSPGQCATEYDPLAPVVYVPYRRGATYIVTGQGCTDIMEGTQSTATPSTTCQDVSPSRATL
jgi:hypothetical protein